MRRRTHVSNLVADLSCKLFSTAARVRGHGPRTNTNSAEFCVTLCVTLMGADSSAVGGQSKLHPGDSSHQRHELAAAGDFEFVENRV